MIPGLKDAFYSLLYPQPCHICGKSVENDSDGIACSECWGQTRIFTGNEITCEKCGAYLREQHPEFTAACNKCNEEHFDLARSAGAYEKALLASIVYLKSRPFLARRVKDILRNAVRSAPFEEVYRVIPVPLSKERMEERGFNQAAVLAASIAGSLKIELDESSLARKLHTEKHRAGMDRKGRLITVENAFEVKRPRLIEGKNILLIDDVFASGATVSNCAKALKKKGAGKVFVLTLARPI